MLNKVKRKERVDIKVCSEKEREKLKRFLNKEPVYHTFLLSDIDRYGFENDFQTVYLQEDRGQCQGVCLRYFNNLILAGDEKTLDYQEIDKLIDSQTTTVMGKAEIVEQVMRRRGSPDQMIRNRLYVYSEKSDSKKIRDTFVKVAGVNDVDRIYEFLMEFPEMRALYSEKKMLENRLESGEGIHVIIEVQGKIAAHGNSAASADQTCMLGGICVKEEYRKRGYAKDILRMLCEEMHRQGKIPCIFAPEEKTYSIFEELGFKVYGAWGVARIPSRKGEKWEGTS